MQQDFDLDQVLLTFNQGGRTGYWTLADSFMGVQVFGSNGSGKTTGSAYHLAIKYLEKNFGGLVLTGKVDERQMWEEYCRLTGRERDLIILEPGKSQFTFNFLEYESARSGGAAYTANIVDVLQNTIRAGEEKDSGRSDDSFWSGALTTLLHNICDLQMLAYGKVDVAQMYALMQSLPREGAPQNRDGRDSAFDTAMRRANHKIDQRIAAWEASKSADELAKLREDKEAYLQAVYDDVEGARLFRQLDMFFMDDYGRLHEKTRSIVDYSLSNFLHGLLREPVFSLFCKNPSTFTPDDCLEGKIILLDLPVKKYNKVGRDCQILFKYIFQRAMERRKVKENSRPVFIFADEAQLFLHPNDSVYQATARSARLATIYITQNLPSYKTAMPGQNSENRVMGFLGTMGTKIFHANSDVQTNEYSSKLLGQELRPDQSDSLTLSSDPSESISRHFKYQPRVRPDEFVSLRTGGARNDFLVGAIIHKQGSPLIGDSNWLRVVFDQTYRP